MRLRTVMLIFAGITCAAASSVWAQNFPSRPIRLVVGFAAGGTPDALARSVATQVENQMGGTVVVDNRGGANGIIAAEIVATAAGNGYTMLWAPPALIINEMIYPKLPYNTLRDFIPVTSVCLGSGYILTVHPAVNARSVKELVALAKSKEKPLTYGTPGIGNTQHLVGELFNVRAGTHLQHVPYKSLAPAITGVLSGEINVLFPPPTVVMGHFKAGRLRALGVTGEKRWQGMPELPAINETVPGFSVSGAWHGWFVPASTPRSIVTRMHTEIKKAVETPKVRDFMITGGYDPDGRSPEEFRKLIVSDFNRYGEVVRIANIKAK